MVLNLLKCWHGFVIPLFFLQQQLQRFYSDLSFSIPFHNQKFLGGRGRGQKQNFRLSSLTPQCVKPSSKNCLLSRVSVILWFKNKRLSSIISLDDAGIGGVEDRAPLFEAQAINRSTQHWRFWKGFQSITAAFYGACDIHRTWQSLPKAFTVITPEASRLLRLAASFWWIGRKDMKSTARCPHQTKIAPKKQTIGFFCNFPVLVVVSGSMEVISCVSFFARSVGR